MSNGFVVLMGMGTVFFGLICIVVLCYLMSLIVRETAKKEPVPAQAPAAVKAAPAPLANKGEIIAAVAAAVAEDLGTDVSGIRIHSFKQV